MQPIHRFLADSVVFADDRRPLDGLEPKTRAALLAVVAGYLPYYTSEQVGLRHVNIAPAVWRTISDPAQVPAVHQDCLARCVQL